MHVRKTLSVAFTKAHSYLTMLGLFLISPASFALANTDLTQDTSGGKTISTVATNIDNTRQIGTTVVLGIFTLVGVLMVAGSLISLHKAAKDEREKPTSAVVGLAVGSCLTAVSVIMWLVRNSVIGT